MIPREYFLELLASEREANGGRLPDALCQAHLVHLADECHYRGQAFPSRRTLIRSWGASDWAVRQHLASDGWKKKCSDLRIPLPEVDENSKPTHSPPRNHPETTPLPVGGTPNIGGSPPSNHPVTNPLASTRAEYESTNPRTHEGTDQYRRSSEPSDSDHADDTAGKALLPQQLAQQLLESAADEPTEPRPAQGPTPAPTARRPKLLESAADEPTEPRPAPSPAPAPAPGPTPSQKRQEESFRVASEYWGSSVNPAMAKRPSKGVSRSSKSGKRLWAALGRMHELEDGTRVDGLDIVMAAFQFIAESRHQRAEFVRKGGYGIETALRHVEDYAVAWWAEHPETTGVGAPPEAEGDEPRRKRLLELGIPEKIHHWPDYRINALLAQWEQEKAERTRRAPPRLGPGEAS